MHESENECLILLVSLDGFIESIFIHICLCKMNNDQNVSASYDMCSIGSPIILPNYAQCVLTLHTVMYHWT